METLLTFFHPKPARPFRRPIWYAASAQNFPYLLYAGPQLPPAAPPTTG
jgi:hypothetical protein